MSNILKIAHDALKIAQTTTQALNGAGVGIIPGIGNILAIGQTVLGTVDAVLPAVQGQSISPELQAARDALRAAIDKRSSDVEAALRGGPAA